MSTNIGKADVEINPFREMQEQTRLLKSIANSLTLIVLLLLLFFIGIIVTVASAT